MGLFALFIRVLFGFFPTLCEYSYSRGLFLGVRWSIDHSTALLPFATLYLFFFFLFVWALQRIYKMYKGRKRARSWRRWWRDTGRAGLNFIGGGIFFFLVMWGYNYARIPLETQIKIDARKLKYTELRDEVDFVMDICAKSRALIPQADTFALTEDYFPENLEEEMHNCLVEVLQEYGYPTVGWVRGRELYPKGLLYGFNSSGVYMPFTGEGHIESALHIIQKPFTLAHEMSHGYGFGDEGICNFLGYMACLKSKKAVIRYSGHVNYWRYVFGELKYTDPEYYLLRRPEIDRGLYNDVEAIYDKMDRYFSEFIPGLQELAYGAYLKMQGVKEGLQSYDRLVLLVAAYRRARGDEEMLDPRR